MEDGTLRFEWSDFPYLGQESVNAAIAARAAQRQGKFWEYHDALYESQGSKNTGEFSDAALVDLAGELGLDVEQFEADLNSEELASLVRRDFEEAQDAGIQGTPSFTINGRVIVGGQPFEAFAEVIEEEARKAGGGA